jgi:exonuclease III
MRIVSWNMDQWGHSASHGDAWGFLWELQPDIALVQEAIVPESLPSRYQALWTRAWETRRWGTAVLCRLADLEVDWQDRSRGALVAAHCSIPPLGRVSIASLHARADGLVVPPLRLTFDALRTRLGDRFIVGGDLNTARAAALAWPDNGHGEFWAELDASEFRDCHYLLHGAERQSFWRDQLRGQPLTVGNALMDDHVFVDRGTLEYVKSADVLDTPEIRKLSDHGPVVVDLVLPAEAWTLPRSRPQVLLRTSKGGTAIRQPRSRARCAPAYPLPVSPRTEASDRDPHLSPDRRARPWRCTLAARRFE